MDAPRGRQALAMTTKERELANNVEQSRREIINYAEAIRSAIEQSKPELMELYLDRIRYHTKVITDNYESVISALGRKPDVFLS